MPFKENGRIIAEPHVDTELLQFFVRKGDTIAFGLDSHSKVARQNEITLPVDDAGHATVFPNEIILVGGSTGFKIGGNKESLKRGETVEVFRSLTSKTITSI